MSDVSKFDSNYYDNRYFAEKDGKSFRRPDGSIGYWSYANPEGEWLGCKPIVDTWKRMFGLEGNNNKALDVGCGRGTFIGYMRDATCGIEAYGFDFSEWAISHLYQRCHSCWIGKWDATNIPWPYEDKLFDLVTVLDLMEHLYVDDIDKVVGEMYRVARRFVFLQIATIGGGSGSGTHHDGYILKKDEKVPVELELYAVAGHVTVQSRDFWIEKLKMGGWRFRDDLVTEFVKRVPADVISNWIKNTIIIVEKMA